MIRSPGASAPAAPPADGDRERSAHQGLSLPAGEAIAPASPASSPPPTDAVLEALAAALRAAADAGRFEVVAQLARELEARRTAAAVNVVQLDGVRRRKPTRA